jgi:LPXTG-motif cell wall-anchored protein
MVTLRAEGVRWPGRRRHHHGARLAPITGADLLGMGIGAVGALGIGGASLVIARRRRNGEV